MAHTPSLSVELVVSFETDKYGHRVLGKIEVPYDTFIWIAARDKVIGLLVANGVRPDDILPCSGDYGTIELVGGSKVVISPLPPFEQYAACVSEYMQTGQIIDLKAGEFHEVSGTLSQERGV